VFANGVKREVWPDGYQIVWFANKDIKQTFSEGKTVYFFAEARTTQTTYPDGL
jgi:centromere protein J